MGFASSTHPTKAPRRGSLTPFYLSPPARHAVLLRRGAGLAAEHGDEGRGAAVAQVEGDFLHPAPGFQRLDGGEEAQALAALYWKMPIEASVGSPFSSNVTGPETPS